MDKPALIPPVADNDLVCFDVDDPERIPGDICFQGPGVYGDGSADKHTDTTVDRAGWSVIQINEEGRLLKALAGPVLQTHPQTSPSSEHHALAAYALYSQGQGLYKGDNKGVITSWTSPASTTSKAQYAGVTRMAKGHSGGRIQVAWVPGHVNPEDHPQGSQDWLDAVGNDLADSWAKKGRLRHSPQGVGEVKAWTSLIETYTKILTNIAGILEVWAGKDTEIIDWTKAKHASPKHALAQLQPPPELMLCHRFRRHLGSGATDRKSLARCTQCLAFKEGKQECQPEKHWVNRHDFKNHAVRNYVTGSGFHLWACERCCAWAQFVPRFLDGYCLASPTRASRRDFDLILAGRHPKYPDDPVTQVSLEQLTSYRLDHASFVERV